MQLFWKRTQQLISWCPYLMFFFFHHFTQPNILSFTTKSELLLEYLFYYLWQPSLILQRNCSIVFSLKFLYLANICTIIFYPSNIACSHGFLISLFVLPSVIMISNPQNVNRLCYLCSQ